MSLSELGKNDVSAEVQAYRDKLASQDTENAGLRNILMKREAELNEIKASLSETLHKLSREADRALQLEGNLARCDGELKRERVSRENGESALLTTQERLRVQECTVKELEATMDTLSQHSQSTTAERRTLEGEKNALDTRVRELQRLVQQHEMRSVSSNISRGPGRPRSSSATNCRLPVVEQELSDVRAQLALKENHFRVLQDKFSRAQDDLVRAENIRISSEKINQKIILDLTAAVAAKEEELEALADSQVGGCAGERETALMQRIEEDEAKIAALEKIAEEHHTNRASQAAYNKLQSRLNMECEKLVRCEELRVRVLHERDELLKERDNVQQEIRKNRELLQVTQELLRDSNARQVALQTELEELREWGGSGGQGSHVAANAGSIPDGRNACFSVHPDGTAVAGQIETLLHAIDRLRNERDDLKRSLEFSETEYLVTTEGYQRRIAVLSEELSDRSPQASVVSSLQKSRDETASQLKRLVVCATAFSVVIAHLHGHLESSEHQLSMVLSEKAAIDSRFIELQQLIQHQSHMAETTERDNGDLRSRLHSLRVELSESEGRRDQSLLFIADLESKIRSLEETNGDIETTREGLVKAQDHLTALHKSYQEVECERNSLSVQVTNLQTDLSHAQEELADIQDRYNILRAQKLNHMSTSEVARTLKDQIRELELRVLRRTEQIGVHQHDIRRLETNMKLQEERITEMTSELEVLTAQKEAMVEDCAEARESRDRVVKALETAEVEVEKLEDSMQEVQNLRTQLADFKAHSETVTGAEAAYKAQIVELRSEASQMQSRLRETINELSLTRTVLEEQQATQEEQARVVQELEQLKRRLCDTDALHDSLEATVVELSEARRLLEDAKANHMDVETELSGQIHSMSQRLQEQGDVQDKLREEQVEYQKARRDLENELDDIKAQLKSSKQSHACLAENHQDALKELALTKEVLEQKLVDAAERLRALHSEHQQSIAALEEKYRCELDVLSSNLEGRVCELEQLRHQFEAENNSRKHAEELLAQEVKAFEERHITVVSLEKERVQTIARMEQRLEEAKSDLSVLQDEKSSLQEQLTNLEAEMQRLNSLTRYLENQKKESESTSKSLRDTLEECQLNLARSEKAGKAAELSLALQTTQHEKVIVALQRELASLQSGSDLRITLAESEEKNREMDDLLKTKCAEIEEYDDRILETLKMNKKLMAKVESLSRKVQVLQARLAAVNNQSASPEVSPPDVISQEVNVLQQPPLQHKTFSPPVVLTPRVLSIAVAPERPAESSEGPAVSIGMKRRAPEDDERDGVPPEGHYSAESPSRHSSTPRLRRTAHAKHAGFTPVRNTQLRGTSRPSSPPRCTATTAVPSYTITDVTNSPRTSSHSDSQAVKKKTWLGRIRSGSATQNVGVAPRPWMPRSNEYDRQ